MMTPRPDRFTYPADRARGGQIVLRKPWMRAIFVGGLVGFCALALVLAMA
ncbi:MAG TPA: hypothetical protein VHE77_21795 [Dongiaceae bacterium]|jgi:hypothetical protein|nr:hypothetical protein [Dongiaceae bacterium]